MARFYVFILFAFCSFTIYTLINYQLRINDTYKMARYESANNEIEGLIFTRKLMEVRGEISSLDHKVYVSDLLKYSNKSPELLYLIIVDNNLEDYSKRFFMDGKISFNEMISIQNKIKMEMERMRLARGIMPNGEFDYRSKL